MRIPLKTTFERTPTPCRSAESGLQKRNPQARAQEHVDLSVRVAGPGNFVVVIVYMVCMCVVVVSLLFVHVCLIVL